MSRTNRKDFPKIAYFEVEHNDCWTHLTEKSNLKIRLLYQKFDIQNPLFNSIIVGKSNYRAELKEFIKNIKYHKSVNNIDELNYNNDNNLFLMDLSLIREGSISKMIHKNNGIILTHEIVDGIEKWIVLTSNYLQLKDEIESNKTSNLLRFNIIYSEDVLYNILQDLTDIEILALKMALDEGFFDYPHKVSIEDLASQLNLSKATFVKHLRNSNKKILMKNYFDLLSLSNSSMYNGRNSR